MNGLKFAPLQKASKNADVRKVGFSSAVKLPLTWTGAELGQHGRLLKIPGVKILKPQFEDLSGSLASAVASLKGKFLPYTSETER